MISVSVRKEVFDRDCGICQICHKPVAFDSMSIDHIVPTSRGGSDEISNLQLSHWKCNISKGNSVFGEKRTRNPISKYRSPKFQNGVRVAFVLDVETVTKIGYLAEGEYRSATSFLARLVSEEYERKIASEIQS